MTIGTTDIFLLVIIISTLVVGFFWGALRSLMMLAVWLFTFVAAAYLAPMLGSYLAQQWSNFPPAYSDMAAYGLIYVGILLAAPVVILSLTKANQRVTRFQVLDDLTGALVATFVAVLGIAGIIIILATFYGTGELIIDPAGGPQWTANLYQSLLNSNIGAAINEELVPIIGTLLGPIMPSEVSEVFG